MKRIGIDCRFAGIPCGLGRYARELASALLARDDAVEYVLIVRSNTEEWLSELPGKPSIVEFPHPHYSFAEQLRLPLLLQTLRLDLFFAPHFNVPVACPVPYVVTIHDLILHRFPNQASLIKQAAYRFLLRAVVRRAAQIITISDFVQDELVHVYGSCIQTKATRVYEGVDPRFTPSSDQGVKRMHNSYNLNTPYYLYVGNAKQHKSVQDVVRAFTELPSSDAELILVCGGKEAADLQLPEGVRILRNVPDTDLPALYTGAICFVTASKYEGFCLPAAEARACGCRIVATDNTAIPEAAGPHATLVPPGNISQLTQALQSARTASPVASERPFTWEETAKQTAAILLQ